MCSTDFILEMDMEMDLQDNQGHQAIQGNQANQVHQGNPSEIWVLVQYQRPIGHYNYKIVHLSEVVYKEKDKMHTGKIIDFKFGNSVMRGVIFIISDEKPFLEVERKFLSKLPMNDPCHQSEVYNRRPIESFNRQSVESPNRQSVESLNRQSVESLNRQSVESFNRQQQIDSFNRQQQLESFNRQQQIESSNRKSMKRPPSPSDYKSNASISRLPSPAWSNNTNESINSNLEKQIFITAPPMTFDQGTQTDLKLLADCGQIHSKDLSKITQQLDMLLIENQQLKKDNQQTKQLLTDMANHTYDVKTMMKDIHKKMEVSDRDPRIINSQMKANNEPIVLFTKSSNQIVNLSHADLDNDVSIETFDVNNESSNISYSNCSRLSAVSNASIYNSTMMASQQSSSSTGESSHNPQNDVKHNWNVIQIETVPDEVTIGTNGTKVHRTVLDTVKWTSHSNATRKLLSTLFTREVLATHSLTGKPSPAFMDSSKPTKNQLNSVVIADIVQYVSQRCGVTDTAVRSAITTKCADENKMYRQRMEKKRNVLHSMENSNNKENNAVDVKFISNNSTL